MSDFQVTSASGGQSYMSLPEGAVEGHGDAVCRRSEGQQGASGTARATGAGGGSSVHGEALAQQGECLDEVLEAVGSCGATLLSAGAFALVTGLACAGTTLATINCLMKDGAGR